MLFGLGYIVRVGFCFLRWLPKWRLIVTPVNDLHDSSPTTMVGVWLTLGDYLKGTSLFFRKSEFYPELGVFPSL